jgi:hypothetical protein
MYSRRISLAAFVALTLAIPTTARCDEGRQAYPVTLKADDVHEFDKLTIQSNGLTVTGKHLLAVPIRCERGITGAMLIGDGEFSFKPKKGEPITGQFRAAMLRFAPADQEALLPLSKGKVITDHAAGEMSQHLLNNVFRHCWHSGMNALIPDQGSFVANVYSRTHGDLLISTGPHSAVVHNFTDRRTLYSTNSEAAKSRLPRP